MYDRLQLKHAPSLARGGISYAARCYIADAARVRAEIIRSQDVYAGDENVQIVFETSSISVRQRNTIMVLRQKKRQKKKKC